MANQVTFQIKIETVGGENVKNVTMDAEELGRVVKEVSDEQEKLNTKLLDINQAQQAIQNVTSGISQLASEVSKYTSVYSSQETAERKVAQVMRNTMSASDAEIESIKELCAAQQELGVIGDEVQLAGAQELATYLEKKSSLEQLIPVMNDMLAQQYGLEASQESAATIATMLGKVMDGQVNALSRYGYSFDEAQEKILKFGTEEERAAVLAEVVSKSVGGMNQSLAKTDSGKAKQAANAIGDIKEQVGECLVSLSPFIDGLSEVGQAAQGVNGVVQGFRGIAQILPSVTTLHGIWNSVVTAGAVAMNNGAAAAAALAAGLRGLLVASGVGIAIMGVVAAVSALRAESVAVAEMQQRTTANEYDPDRTRAALNGLRDKWKANDAAKKAEEEAKKAEEALKRASAAASAKPSKQLPIESVNMTPLKGLDLSGFSAEIDLTPRIDEESALKDLNNLGWEVEMKVDSEGLRKMEREADKSRKKVQGAADSVVELGCALSGLGEAVGVPELNVAGTMAQAIATMVSGFATATAQASSMGPWAWIAFAALGLTQLTAMISSVKSVAKFADGAVAFGPTLGLFGEYSNAATNPEVVAPLDRLRAIIGVEGSGAEGPIEFRIRSRDLVALHKKRMRGLSRG